MNTTTIISLIAAGACTACTFFCLRTTKQLLDTYEKWTTKKEKEWAHLRSRIDIAVRNNQPRKRKFYQTNNETQENYYE